MAHRMRRRPIRSSYHAAPSLSRRSDRTRRLPKTEGVAARRRTIYIDRCMAKKRTKAAGKGPRVLSGGRKRVLVVLFVPSVERDGATPIDQPRWVDSSLEMFGRVFGGATAYPKAKGVWRDDERHGVLVRDVHCYTTPADIEDPGNLGELGSFCRTMGREARQGEVGLVIGDEYFAIGEFSAHVPGR